VEKCLNGATGSPHLQRKQPTQQRERKTKDTQRAAKAPDNKPGIKLTERQDKGREAPP
jgi:hypothetical protein